MIVKRLFPHDFEDTHLLPPPNPQLLPTQIATHHHLVCGQPGYGPVDVWLLVPVIEATTTE